MGTKQPGLTQKEMAILQSNAVDDRTVYQLSRFGDLYFCFGETPYVVKQTFAKHQNMPWWLCRMLGWNVKRVKVNG